jgi:hypothetical protein
MKQKNSLAGEVIVGTGVTPSKNKSIIKHNTSTFFPVSLITSIFNANLKIQAL